MKKKTSNSKSLKKAIREVEMYLYLAMYGILTGAADEPSQTKEDVVGKLEEAKKELNDKFNCYIAEIDEVLNKM